LIYILYTLFFISCLLVVVSVLLQPGKTDAGALFTSNISNAAFAPRGTATVLAKITIVSAAAFMILALFISMPVFRGGVSVLDSSTGNIQTEETASPATSSAPPSEAPANNAPAGDQNSQPESK
jgi:protein translocase SecG subunit